MILCMHNIVCCSPLLLPPSCCAQGTQWVCKFMWHQEKGSYMICCFMAYNCNSGVTSAQERQHQLAACATDAIKL